MKPRIETLSAKKLIGKRVELSFSNDRTVELWRSFMPRRREIQNSIGTDLYSMQIYPPSFYDPFNPERVFEKWAAIEVAGFSVIPADMESFELPGGLYAVFLYKGVPSEGAATFRYIIGSWLPDSGYILDDRPHFEILGEKYKNNDPGSEEEIWIPIRLK